GGEFLVRETVAGKMEDRTHGERREPRPAGGARRGAGRHVECNDHGAVPTRPFGVATTFPIEPRSWTRLRSALRPGSRVRRSGSAPAAHLGERRSGRLVDERKAESV